MWDKGEKVGLHLISDNKKYGRIGVGKLAKWKALLGMWLWRFPFEVGALWVKVISTRYAYEVMDGFLPTRYNFKQGSTGI